jgi:antitoxin component YwqK of YwqJK toxin-antitoxin module
MTETNQRNKEGNRHGYWEHYGIDGKLWCKGTYENGIKIGLWEQYYNNGNLWYKGHYHNGQRHGLWEIWNDVELEIQIFYS